MNRDNLIEPMKMYERFIPKPVTLEDFADHFRETIGSLSEVDNRKLFVGWLIDKFKGSQLREYLGLSDSSFITYYLKKHKEHLETDEIYRRKFERL